MREINISVNKGKYSKMRNILGMVNIPRIISQPAFERDKNLYDALNLKHVRFHDAAIENPSFKIVDISCIFPLFHLDETKAENYFFSQTDDYLKYLDEKDVEIDFRLGETIDHSGFGRLINVPDDIDKWAKICRNIIGHYKNGEMNGMHLNIKRVSVWEEPDNPKLFAGTVEDYAQMFIKVYRLIKKDFPDIQVGGPTITGHAYEWLEKFLTICKDNDVKPDYISITMYGINIKNYCDDIEKFKNVSDRIGFADMKYIFAEWHLCPQGWSRTRYMSENHFDDVQSAAFSAGFLSTLIDMEYMDAAYYYSWACAMWGLCNFLEPEYSPMPVYYGLLLYQKLGAECENRVEVTADESGFTYLLAGETDDKKTRVLITCYQGEDCLYNVNVGNIKSARLMAVEDVLNVKDATEGKITEAEDRIISIECKGGYGVYLLEF